MIIYYVTCFRNNFLRYSLAKAPRVTQTRALCACGACPRLSNFFFIFFPLAVFSPLLRRATRRSNLGLRRGGGDCLTTPTTCPEKRNTCCYYEAAATHRTTDIRARTKLKRGAESERSKDASGGCVAPPSPAPPISSSWALVNNHFMRFATLRRNLSRTTSEIYFPIRLLSSLLLF